MILSAEHTIFFTAGGVLFSIGGAWITLRNTSVKADNALRASEAIGRKLDELRNEFVEFKTAIDKDIEAIRMEIKHFNENHLTRKDIADLVSKKECNSKFSTLVPKSEFEQTLKLINLRFKHIEEDTKEMKKDIKDILKILNNLMQGNSSV